MKEQTLQWACMALFLLLNPEATKGQEVKMRGDIMTADWLHSFPRTDDGRNARQTALGPTSTVGDLLVHPAFTGFAKRILPWDDRPYDASLPLSNVGTMLPYHSHVDAGVVISGLNRMIADVSSGKTIFYDIYTEAEKRAQPAKEHTGLFFFRGPPGAPFALIAAGGGFAYVGSVHEGFPYALDINNRGYNAFVLKYRTGQGGRVATEDLATAVSFVVRNAATLEVGTEDYSLWGSSAGARMAAFIGSHGVAAFNGDNLPKPSAVVMAYTAHADTSSNEPPTFAVVGEQDGIAPPSSMESRIVVLHRSGTPVEFHRYPNVGHGFGTGRGTSADGWIINAVRFWERRMNSNASK